MSRLALVSLGFLVLAQTVPLQAQRSEPHRPTRCTGSGPGAEPPAWYTSPPKPPSDAYQAEARSGRCTDAEAAQQVAARVASWLLVYQKSPRAVLEEVELRRRATARAGAWDRLQREFEVVQRAVARTVLERSWVFRQTTRWTEEGRAEHFLLIRADTAALRETAAEELEAYFENPDAYLAEGRREFADQELRWAHLTDSRGTQKAAQARERQEPSPRTQKDSSPPAPPPLKRVVVSWRADPTDLEGSGRPERPQEGRLGVTLSRSDAPWQLAVGVSFERPRDRALAVSGQSGQVRITGARELAAYGLLIPPRQVVPIYAGYRARRSFLHLPARVDRLERSGRAVVLGLGVPPFTELRRGRVRNAYLEAALWPKLLRLEAGTRVRMADLPGASLNGLFQVSLGFSKLADADTLGTASFSRTGEVYLDQFTAEAGLELLLGDAVGLFAVWEYDSSELKLLAERDGDSYAPLIGSSQLVGREARRLRLSVGLRLRL